MRIRELIEKLQHIESGAGDIPVCIKDASQTYDFSFMEVMSVEYFHKDLGEEDTALAEEQGTEIYEFVGLSYD